LSSDWERLAREDPIAAIDPTLAGVDIDALRAGGTALVADIVSWVQPPRGRALEIGIGVGRNLVHLAEHFERVDGVDVSPTMVALAREHGLPANVEVQATNGRDLAPFADDTFHFVFSTLVLQHIAEEDVVAGYIRETARVLRPGGRAALQLDTRELMLLARAGRLLPDALLPGVHRRAMRRYPRSSAWVRDTVHRAGLGITAERGADTALHWFSLYRPGG